MGRILGKQAKDHILRRSSVGRFGNIVKVSKVVGWDCPLVMLNASRASSIVPKDSVLLPSRKEFLLISRIESVWGMCARNGLAIFKTREYDQGAYDERQAESREKTENKMNG